MVRKIPPGTECVYCGDAAEDWDHVPPKSLFGKQNRQGLIKVPTCRVCNNGEAKDDQYLLQMLVMREDTQESPDAREGHARLLRGMQDPKRHGYLMATMAGFEFKERVAGGVLLGKHPAFRINWQRVDRSVARIIRGLFAHQHGSRLPDDYVAVAYHCEGYDPYDIKMMATLKWVHDAALSGSRERLGEGVLEYGCGTPLDDPHQTVWALRFYDAPSFIGFTKSRDTMLPEDEAVAF